MSPFLATERRPAPRLLVSVRDADEAALACAAGADLVDAKDPARGALGALPSEIVRAIRAAVAGRAVTSAVAGEPDDDAALHESVAAMAATGVDLVKVALHDRLSPGGLARAAAAAPGRLIAVLFAEDAPTPVALTGVLSMLAQAGLSGAMIDTRGKAGRRLTDLLKIERLSAFTAACRAHGLLCGLAGSLRPEDLPALAPLGPDYLGLRGGLCRDGDRRGGLDPQRVGAAVAALAGHGRRDAA